MKFITRAQELGKRAAQLGQAVHALPGHAARIREAVTMTGGELKQLRAEVHSSIQGLRADSEDHLLSAMREINNHTAILEEAGYDLDGMDLDLALNQRLAVHLSKFESVPHSMLRSIPARQMPETVRSVINGIIKAEETAANVELSHLLYRGLIIHIGLVPMIRMLWRDAVPAEGEQPVQAAVVPIASPTPSVAQTPVAESMFDLRPLPGAARSDLRSSPAMASGPVGEPEPSHPTETSSWSKDALARFKQMPGVSKYGR